MAESGCLRDVQVQNLEVAGTFTQSTPNNAIVIAGSANQVYTLSKEQSGSTVVVASVDTSLTIKLPSPTNGMNFTIAYAGADETEDITIDTQSNTNYLSGALNIFDADATGAVSLDTILPDGNSNSKLTLKDPQSATWVKLVSNGTLWYHFGGITTATAVAVVYADQ